MRFRLGQDINGPAHHRPTEAARREIAERTASSTPELWDRLGEELGLTLDVGHCPCTGDLPVERFLAESADVLRNVHLDDTSGGRPDHRQSEEVDPDLAATLSALKKKGYVVVASVELGRDGHRGPKPATEAMSPLRRTLQLNP